MTKDEFINEADTYIEASNRGDFKTAGAAADKIVQFLTEIDPPKDFRKDIEDTIVEAVDAKNSRDSGMLNLLFNRLLSLINKLYSTYVNQFSPAMAAELVEKGISFR